MKETRTLRNLIINNSDTISCLIRCFQCSELNRKCKFLRDEIHLWMLSLRIRGNGIYYSVSNISNAANSIMNNLRIRSAMSNWFSWMKVYMCLARALLFGAFDFTWKRKWNHVPKIGQKSWTFTSFWDKWNIFRRF